MSKVVLKVENISKQYRLGQLGTGTISHDLNRFWAKIRGKEDPYLKVGEANDRSKSGGSDYVWSLKDINFEVNQGDVLGIIGKNGAGKSTLLKILSQVTTPTTGQVKAKGRIASLLEVGTGFHPDLTGRENIFLNGAILGMTKAEIKSKLDEIVEFSGVANYLDTPVKRYSSGMMVRLGFAVAAHLEPEILIVDEVLAVGDAEFQDKCLGKMKDVSGQGRTVLFVSHNMTAVSQLCTKCLLLSNGLIDKVGPTNEIIGLYNKKASIKRGGSLIDIKRSGLGEIKFSKIEISNKKANESIKSGDDLQIKLGYTATKIDKTDDFEFVVGVWNSFGIPMFMLTNKYLNKTIKLTQLTGSVYFNIENLPINTGTYVINLLIKKNGLEMDFIEEAFSFEVENGNYYNHSVFYPEHYQGIYCDFNMNY